MATAAAAARTDATAFGDLLAARAAGAHAAARVVLWACRGTCDDTLVGDVIWFAAGNAPRPHVTLPGDEWAGVTARARRDPACVDGDTALSACATLLSLVVRTDGTVRSPVDVVMFASRKDPQLAVTHACIVNRGPHGYTLPFIAPDILTLTLNKHALPGAAVDAVRAWGTVEAIMPPSDHEKTFEMMLFDYDPGVLRETVCDVLSRRLTAAEDPDSDLVDELDACLPWGVTAAAAALRLDASVGMLTGATQADIMHRPGVEAHRTSKAWLLYCLMAVFESLVDGLGGAVAFQAEVHTRLRAAYADPQKEARTMCRQRRGNWLMDMALSNCGGIARRTTVEAMYTLASWFTETGEHGYGFSFPSAEHKRASAILAIYIEEMVFGGVPDVTIDPVLVRSMSNYLAAACMHSILRGNCKHRRDLFLAEMRPGI